MAAETKAQDRRHDSAVCRARWLPWLVVVATTLGCYSVPEGRSAVDRVSILENNALDDDLIRERIATAESPRFLGIWDGVGFDYEYYDKFVVQRDLERIERLYRANGYYDAHVRAARVIETGKGHVRVEIVVDEGPPVTIKREPPSGLDTVPFVAQAAVMDAYNRGPKDGDIFNEQAYEQTKADIQAVLMARGFAWARVRGHVVVNIISHEAQVRYTIDAGPRFKIRTVTIRGLEDIPEKPVRRALAVEVGDEFSAEQLELAKLALIDLQVFADVEVTWTQPMGEETEEKPAAGQPERASRKQVPKNEAGEPAVDVVVQVVPAPLHGIKLGFGAELDVIRTDVHGVAGWESRNFLGGLRRLSITAKPGVVLFPTRLTCLVSPEEYLPEGRLQTEFRQPGFIEARTGGIVRTDLSIFPVLLQRGDCEAPPDVILGYREVRGSVGLDRSFFGTLLYLATFAHSQSYYPFTYLGILDPDLRLVRINYLELQSNLNLRDDPIRPHKGLFLLNNVQVASSVLEGSVRDLKLQPEARFYVPISRTVTFAVRGTMGLLFPGNYGESLREGSDLPEGQRTRDQQLLYFRAFFSGGPNSNRGYPFRGVGPHGPALFLAPSLSSQQLDEACNPAVTGGQVIASNDACRVPLGGLTLWEASAEVRYPIIGPLSGAVFADTSDVHREQTTFAFEYLHLSTGLGLRYDTPVGPVRVDVGYRVPGLQKVGGELDIETEGDPGTVFGAPMAFSIAVGEAF